jgi:hypothetical protein
MESKPLSFADAVKYNFLKHANAPEAVICENEETALQPV